MRKPLAISLAAALSFVPLAHAQTPPLPAQTGVLSQDVSDLWWDSTQSGWGLGLFQSGTFVFATLFVYNSSNQAAWFTANLTSQGNGLYTGPLYQTTGPYYASTTFDPTQVTRSQVGTMSFAV